LHANLTVACRFGERSVDSLAALEGHLERRGGKQLIDIVPFEFDHAGRRRIERDSASVQRFDLAREPIAVLEQRDVALSVRASADRERYDKKGASWSGVHGRSTTMMTVPIRMTAIGMASKFMGGESL
jgi:hypothetical protein